MPIPEFDRTNAKEEYSRRGSWLRFGDGDEATVAIIGDTYVRDTIFFGSHSETYDNTHPKHIEWMSQPTKDGKPRRLFTKESGNVVIKYAEGEYAVKILELSRKHWDAISARVSRYGKQKWYTIMRSGSGPADTRYDCDPGPDWTEEDLAAFENLEWFNFEEFYKKGAARRQNGDDSFNYGANAE